MQLTALKLTDFRNYEKLDLLLGPGLNVFMGDNAQGKTNLLEAVYLCALGRSHRTVRDKELVRYGQAAGAVTVWINGGLGQRSVSVGVSPLPASPKLVKVDAQRVKRLGELMGALMVVMFAPEDHQLIGGGPGVRRRYMDMTLSQLRPSYFYALQSYNRALLQRNHLLKTRRLDIVAAFDAQLSKAGARIVFERQAMMADVAGIVAAEHHRLSGGEELVCRYRQCVRGETLEELEAALMAALTKGLSSDIARAHTQIGAHRDDVSMELNGRDIRLYGSQGQKRSAALSLRLAQCTYMERMSNERPVLLLDDVFSELDAQRRAALSERLAQCQTLLTCTEWDRVAADARLHLVNAGRVESLH